MKAKWSQLTKEQQDTFGNGCGLNIRLLNLKDKLLTASCRHHDFNYARGGTKEDRFKADSDFLVAMLRDIQESGMVLIERQRYTRRAIIFYILVRLFGWVAFKYGRYLSIEEVLEQDKK